MRCLCFRDVLCEVVGTIMWEGKTVCSRVRPPGALGASLTRAEAPSCRVIDDLSDDALSDFADVLGAGGGRAQPEAAFEWDSGDSPRRPTSLRL